MKNKNPPFPPFSGQEKPRPCGRDFPRNTRLRARHILGARALLAVDDIEVERVAHLEFAVRDAGKIVGVEEEVLRLAFASDETESFLRQSLDCSCHFDCLNFEEIRLIFFAYNDSIPWGKLQVFVTLPGVEPGLLA